MLCICFTKFVHVLCMNLMFTINIEVIEKNKTLNYSLYHLNALENNILY